MRAEEITLREVYGRMDMDFEDGFGELPAPEDDEEVEMSVLRDTAASEQLREASVLANRSEQAPSQRLTR
jgi:hypothetical protein